MKCSQLKLKIFKYQKHWSINRNWCAEFLNAREQVSNEIKVMVRQTN